MHGVLWVVEPVLAFLFGKFLLTVAVISSQDTPDSVSLATVDSDLQQREGAIYKLREHTAEVEYSPSSHPILRNYWGTKEGKILRN